MKQKHLRVTMLDGSMWDIPINAIAGHRATYYAQNSSNGKYKKIYDAEFAYAMDSDGELIDWASNNMDWSDVSINAIKVKTTSPPPNYEDDWVNADKEIV